MMDFRKINVLVVDDDADILELIVFNFEHFGFNVSSTTDIDEAIQIHQNQKIHFIVSDINLPDGGGLRLLDSVNQSNTETNDTKTKVYLMTGQCDYSVAEMLDRGADGLYYKPFGATEIKDAIKRTFASNCERWDRPPLKTQLCIKKEFKNKEDFFSSSDFSFGRGGVAYSTKESFPQVNSYISFVISFSQEDKIKSLEGDAQICWSLPQEDGQTQYGLEFRSIKEPGRQWLSDYIEQLECIPYIPVIKKAA